MSLYIHIPFCISKCAYCDFFSKPCNGVDEKYIEALCNEIEYRLSYYKIKNLETIYIGGGTPSLLKAEQFNKIFSKIRNCTKLDSDTEITVEVNPDDVNEKLLKTLSDCGVNRISCGIQSMNDRALKKACRRADAAVNKKALEVLQNKWKGQISLDLISGLPEDGKDELLNSLKEVCSIKPDHISLYSLTIEENTPFGKQLDCGKLSYDFDFADKLWLCGRDYLESQGYKWYEVSNFCQSGNECRHNLRYWNHKSYLGCGSGACGTVYLPDGSGDRWTNTTDVEEYCNWWLNSTTCVSKSLENESQIPQTSENIDLSTSKFEFFMMGLRKLSGVSEKEYFETFGQKFPEQFLYLFYKWLDKKLCVIDGDGRYCMSREGMLFLNRFLEELY